MTEVARFSINHTQFLDENGNATQTLPAFCENHELLVHLYRTMFHTRAFDDKAIKLQRTGKMGGTYASSLGQEAIFVGYGSAMRESDVLVPYYRDYGAMFQRGITMVDILRYWGGDEQGNHFAAKEDFPICVPIASQCLHAAGVAKAIQYRKQSRAVVVTIGDGGTSEGDFYEALNVAGDWKLPVVFIINNNQWAISVPRAAQTGAETLAQKAIAAGIIGEQVDGNDVIAMRHVAECALERARNGEGPTVIEAMTYRLCDHTTSDDAKRYVNASDLEAAWAKEPLVRLRHYLAAQGLWDDTKEEQLRLDCREQIEAAVQEYVDTPTQPIASMFDYHYAELPLELARQRHEAVELGGEHD